MKLIKLCSAIGFSMLISAGTAYATGQGSGEIEFNGEIIDAPCSIAPNDDNQKFLWAKYHLQH